MQYLGAISKNTEWSQFIFKANHLNIIVIQVYALITNAEEGEAEWFYEDLQDFLELTPKKKDVLFIKIIADGGCSHEIKRHLLLGRKTDKPR